MPSVLAASHVLRPFQTATVGRSLLALDPPHRFRMRFPQRDPLSPLSTP